MTRDEAFVKQEPVRSTVALGTGGANLVSSPRLRSECAFDIDYLQSPHRDVLRAASWNAELWKTCVLPMYAIISKRSKGVLELYGCRHWNNPTTWEVVGSHGGGLFYILCTLVPVDHAGDVRVSHWQFAGSTKT